MTVANGFFAHGGFIDGIEGDSHFDEFFMVGHCTGATPLGLVLLLLNTLAYHKVAILVHKYSEVLCSIGTVAAI